MSGRSRILPGRGNSAAGSVSGPAAGGLIGKIQSVIGSGTLARPGGIAVPLKVGDPVCRGDIIETSADGQVGIHFIDGTIFSVSNSARMVLKEFVCEGTSPSALLDIASGTFAFFGGEMAKAGALAIETPHGSIRGRSRSGGIGMLSLAALFFAIMEEAHATPDNDGHLDYGNIPYAGFFELTTHGLNPRSFIVDNPNDTIVLHRGSSEIVSLANSPAQMALLQSYQQEALHVFALAQTVGPTVSGSNAGSGTEPGLLPPPFMQHINFINTQSLLPLNFDNGQYLGGPTTHATDSVYVPLPPPPPPPPPPSTPSPIEELPNETNSAIGRSASGTLPFNDISTVSIKTTSFVWSGGVLTTTTGLENLLTFTGSGSIDFSFSAPDKTFDFLAQNQTLTVTYNTMVTLTDGTSYPHQIIITVTGSNDAPVVAADTTTSHPLTEQPDTTGSSTPDTASAQLSFTDVDLTDTHNVTIGAPAATWSAGPLSGLTTADATALSTALDSALSYTLTDSTNSGAGSVALAFSAADDAFDFLAQDQTLTVTYNVTVTDTYGAQSTQPVTFIITGTDDAPVTDLNGSGASGTNASASFLQGTPILIAPLAIVSDVDSPDLQSASITLTNKPDGAAESLSLNSAAAALAAADSLSVTYTAATGVLSITGLASQTDYQTILQGVLYNDISVSPNITERVVTVVVSDGYLSSTSNSVTISVTPLVDPNDFDEYAAGATVVTNSPYVYGTPTADSFAGGGAVGQIIYAGAGDDSPINGSSNNDIIYGGSGNDQIKGNGGNDTIYGGSGNDTIDGSNGNDIIVGGYGADQLTGGNGNDSFVYLSVADSHAGQFDVISDFAPGSDEIDLTSFSLTAADFNPTHLNSDSAGTQIGGYAIDWFYDSAAHETIVYVNPTANALGIGDSGLLEIHLTQVSTVQATDFIYDNSQVNILLTTSADLISLVDGTNSVQGTDTTATNGDVMIGGIGNDTLTIDTGQGINHTYSFGDGASSHSDIGLRNFENLTLTDTNADAGHEDSVTVIFNSDFQNNGPLTVDGSSLNNLTGTNLTIDAHLATHDSFVFIGSAAADTLIGGSQNDTIIGGGGGDTMTGGGGNDTFVFKAIADSQPGAGHFDTITDFAPGLDHIDVSAILGLNSNNQTVTFESLSSVPTSIAAHTIDIVTMNGNTVIFTNASGATESIGGADMEIHLNNVTNVQSNDFILHH